MTPRKRTLDYARPQTPRPDRTSRLIIALLLTFLALASGFLGFIIYGSWLGG